MSPQRHSKVLLQRSFACAILREVPHGKECVRQRAKECAKMREEVDRVE